MSTIYKSSYIQYHYRYGHKRYYVREGGLKHQSLVDKYGDRIMFEPIDERGLKDLEDQKKHSLNRNKRLRQERLNEEMSDNQKVFKSRFQILRSQTQY